MVAAQPLTCVASSCATIELTVSPHFTVSTPSENYPSLNVGCAGADSSSGPRYAVAGAHFARSQVCRVSGDDHACVSHRHND